MSARLRWMATLAVLAAVLTLIPYMAQGDNDGNPALQQPTDGQERPARTTTTRTTAVPTTTTTLQVHQEKPPLEVYLTLPTLPELACDWVNQLGRNKYLTRAEGLCLPIAEAYLDLITGVHGIPTQLDRLPPSPGDPDFVLEFFTQDVVHMVYVMSYESGGDPLANGRNWGCPRQETLRPFHPSPDEDCRSFANRVPIGWVSHMSHLVEDRSSRILGWQINPYDLYEASLLAFGLVFETGGNGWYHWWHIHWGLNSYIVPLGIQGVFHCPPGPYWQNVRGGVQVCPYA